MSGVTFRMRKMVISYLNTVNNLVRSMLIVYTLTPVE